MPKHSTRVDSGHFDLRINDDGTWPIELIQAALLADIRRRLDTAAGRDAESVNLARQTLTVLRRIDRRLAKRIKLR